MTTDTTTEPTPKTPKSGNILRQLFQDLEAAYKRHNLIDKEKLFAFLREAHGAAMEEPPPSMTPTQGEPLPITTGPDQTLQFVATPEPTTSKEEEKPTDGEVNDAGIKSPVSGHTDGKNEETDGTGAVTPERAESDAPLGEGTDAGETASAREGSRDNAWGE